jgi:hypothetical protein
MEALEFEGVAYADETSPSPMCGSALSTGFVLTDGWTGHRPRLHYWMDYCMEHPDELNKISSVQKKVSLFASALSCSDSLLQY